MVREHPSVSVSVFAPHPVIISEGRNVTAWMMPDFPMLRSSALARRLFSGRCVGPGKKTLARRGGETIQKRSELLQPYLYANPTRLDVASAEGARGDKALA